MKAVLVLAAVAATARAGDRSAAITTQPLALVGRGISVGYEHLVTARFSVVGLAGARATALGDYSSTTLTTGGELRFWPLAPLRGVYVAVHASAGRTSVVDETMNASIGSSLQLTERIDVGWRFVLWRRLSLAPMIGIGDHQDFDLGGRLAAFNSPTVMTGFELGWYL